MAANDPRGGSLLGLSVLRGYHLGVRLHCYTRRLAPSWDHRWYREVFARSSPFPRLEVSTINTITPSEWPIVEDAYLITTSVNAPGKAQDGVATWLLQPG